MKNRKLIEWPRENVLEESEHFQTLEIKNLVGHILFEILGSGGGGPEREGGGVQFPRKCVQKETFLI